MAIKGCLPISDFQRGRLRQECIERQTAVCVEFPSIETKVKSLDLSAVIAKVRKQFGLSADDTEIWERLYRQFLILHGEFPNQGLVPPRAADEVWHAHILDTRTYFADCDDLFGRYFHHTPSDEPHHEEFEKTKALYLSRFGEDLDALGKVIKERWAASGFSRAPSKCSDGAACADVSAGSRAPNFTREASCV